MRTFCETFGITKVEAPSTGCKRVQKKKAQKNIRRPPRPPKPFKKKDNSKPPASKKKQPSKKKKTIVYYKCSKTSHKAFQCKPEQKINELFSGEPKLKKKLLALLTKDVSGSEEE